MKQKEKENLKQLLVFTVRNRVCLFTSNIKC